MKKQIFIIIGAIIVFVLILIWAYLLVFGTPKTTEDVYSDLGLAGEEDTSVIPVPLPVSPEELPQVVIAGAKLRQLTTKSVAGFREINNGTSSASILYYSERGTGHIYTINLSTGEESRLSGTTIAQAYEAAFSSDGKYAAITSVGSSKNRSLFVGEINKAANSLDEIFTETVHDFSLSGTKEVLYTITNGQGLTAYSYNIETDSKKTLFTVPFREATILWGDTATSSHYIYPKTTYALSGFLYEAKGDTLNRLPVDGLGFSAIANSEIILYTKAKGITPTSYVYDRKTKTTKTLNTVLLPEKCYLPNAGTTFVCGSESVILPYEFPDEWYKGNIGFKDLLWEISATDMASKLLVDTFDTAREIDVINLERNQNETAFYFINKNDNSLWTYEI